MKKLLIFLVAATFGLTAAAQHEGHTQKTTEQSTHVKEHLMMMDGKMMHIKDGKTMELNQDMQLSNGATIAKDGTMKMKNGKTRKLKNGEMIYMNGKMGKMPANKTSKAKSTSMSMPMKGC
ncbi:MAG: hypothetical protein INR73_07715 [Williamsia sp.]|nr:hypothetical protein [Williamsia sp.]